MIISSKKPVEDVKICGHAFFPNGCQLTVNYVSGCLTTNGALQAHVGNSTANYIMSVV